MIAAILSLLWSGILSLIGLQKKDPIEEEQKHAIQESQEDAQAFVRPPRTKRDVIDDFRLHEHDR